MLHVGLNVAGQLAVVVGGGPAAEQKVHALLDAGAVVRVVSPAFTPELERLGREGRIELAGRRFAPGETAGATLVVAATGDPGVDGAVSAEAAKAGRLVCVTGDPAAGNLHFAAEVRRGPVTVAIHTGGASPALARRIRREVERAVGPEFGVLAQLLGALRERLKGTLGVTQAERASAFREIVEGPALDLLARGETDAARTVIKAVEQRVTRQQETE